jgi:6-phospho-beta-glucosidase
MKVTIVGGSSFSTPALLRFLDQQKERDGIEIMLAGRSRKKLDAVKRASERIVSEDLRISARQITGDTWEQILGGADCVLIQIRVGGFEGRLFDETFPHNYGMCGDEGLGVGGLAAAWRTWPEAASILDAITKFAPQALVIMLTSPVGLLVRASLAHTNLNVVGICELPWTTLQKLSGSVNRRPGDLNADYFGLNHLGWFFNIRSGSIDLIDELANAAGVGSFPSATFLRTHRCVPTSYLRLHYETRQALAEQMSQTRPRAEVLKEIRDDAYRVYRSGEAGEITSALERRATPWYSQAVGPLLLGIGGRPTELPFFLSTLHGSPAFPVKPTDVVEAAYRCIDGQLVRLPLSGMIPEHISHNVLPFVEFERTATEAIKRQSVPLLFEALSLHPWTRDNRDLRTIAQGIASQKSALSVTGPESYR